MRGSKAMKQILGSNLQSGNIKMGGKKYRPSYYFTKLSNISITP
jgi:hypothetical protein